MQKILKDQCFDAQKCIENVLMQTFAAAHTFVDAYQLKAVN